VGGTAGPQRHGQIDPAELVNGDLLPQSGVVARQQNLRVAYLPQEIPQGLAGTVAEIVLSGLQEAPTRRNMPGRPTAGGTGISRMSLEPRACFDSLSAGLKRACLLARGLVRAPDLLLLDEPTNHLDIQSIDWLEPF